ncbi:MAG: HDIG domain-containing protein [Candidatus Aenigmarchaeota archaeon]|nr:HDIG domain-containing protein [Candidatus Aenigmarchaeota archaeon]
MTEARALALVKMKFAYQPVVLEHVMLVKEKAEEIAKKLIQSGVKVDLELVKVGALIHDIGRSVTHDIRHGIIGGEILRELGYPELARFAETHIGGGISKEEAKKLGLPPKDYFPKTLEEKIVAYADKFVEGEIEFSSSPTEDVKRKNIKYDTILPTIKKYERVLGKDHPAIKRLINLQREIESLIK